MRNQKKIRLFTCLLIAAFLCSILPLVSNGTIQNEVSVEGIFPGVKHDFYMPTGTENDIYAIASDGNVWHWNGAWWWQVTSGRTIEDRIQVVASDEIYGLSRNSEGQLNVYRWNGTAWSYVTNDGSLIEDFELISENQIYAIGEDHQVYLWNGNQWSACTTGTQTNGVKDHIQVVSGVIYGINMQNQLVKWNGANWEILAAQGTIKGFFDLKAENEIYAINQSGTVIYYNGQSWYSLTSGSVASRRISWISQSEIFTLASDAIIWQWNGEEWVKITSIVTDSNRQTGTTYYRVKYIEGNVTGQPAIQAFQDKLIIAAQGTDGGVYIREWQPYRNESWDSARNSQNLGSDTWYGLGGSTVTSPELKVENGVLSVYVLGEQGGIYRKTYIGPHRWSDSWMPASLEDFSPGPWNTAGYTIVPIDSDGYPSPAAIVKFKNYTVPTSIPQDLNKLIIYELTTKEFTSPNGPGTGTFASATQKIGYLHDLGVNTIWLSGNVWCDPLHFTNTSTQYSVIHPGLLDPSLGSDPSNVSKTEQELKSFIDTAHQNQIKVLLDVVPHGVMSYSPLVSENTTFPSYVPPYPAPLNITAHPDWFGVLTAPSESEYPVDKASYPQDTRMIDFIGGYEQADLEDWWVNVWTNYVLQYGIDGVRIDLGSSRFDLWARIKENAYNAGHEIIIMPEGEVQDYPFEEGVYDFEQANYAWNVFAKTLFGKVSPSNGAIVYDAEKAQKELFPNLPRQFNTVPISCHDSLAYDLQKSRFKMAYGALFMPFIPIFMAGEEFDNPQTQVPGCTVPWLLASPLQWDKLQQPQNNLFHDDMKKAIEIKLREPALTYFSLDIKQPNLALVDYTPAIYKVPTPYMRYLPDGGQAILIAGNNNSVPIDISMKLPLNQTGLEGAEYYDVVDLWTGQSSTITHDGLSHFTITVSADNFRVLKVTPHLGPAPTTSPISTLAPSVQPTAKPTLTPKPQNSPTPTPTQSTPQPTPNYTQNTPFPLYLFAVIAAVIFVAVVVLLAIVNLKNRSTRLNYQSKASLDSTKITLTITHRQAD